MFDTLLKNLDEQGRGVRAYDACARAARNNTINHPDKAAAFLLIAIAAQRFVDAYDDQPLTVEKAGEEFDQIGSLIALLGDAYATDSAEKKIAALNTVAAQLAAATPRT